MKYKELAVKKYLNQAVTILEFLLAAIVVIGTIWYLINGISELFNQSMGSKEFFFSFINLLLSVIIGIEVSRILVTHNLMAIIEILGFVMARKLLSPDTTALEILLVMGGFILLIGARWILQRGDSCDDMSVT